MFVEVRLPQAFKIRVFSPDDPENDGSAAFDDIISKTIVSTGSWEPFETEIFHHIWKTLGKSGDTFVDVGTHLGYYSLMHAAMGANVVSFEQTPLYAGYYRASLRENGFEAEVFDRRVSRYTNGMDVSLDDAIPSDAHVTSLKLDTEGMEPQIIKGAKRLVERRQIKAILAEISPRFTAEYGGEFLSDVTLDDYVQMVEFVAASGYKVFDIGLSHPRSLCIESNPMLSQEIKPIDVGSSREMADYLMTFQQSNFLFVDRGCVDALFGES